MGEGINGDAGGLAAAPYDQWLPFSTAGGSTRPSARYKHAAEVVQDKLYVVGGSRNGRYLSDIQVFDFRTFKWSVLSPTRDSNQLNTENSTTDQSFPAIAGHSLAKWKNNIIVVAGNTRTSTSNKVSVWLINMETNSWSSVDTYGKVPISRGGQSVSLIGSRLIMFGGEDNKRRLLNDLHILDLETMMWEEVKTEKCGPAPRYDHSAAVYADQYLLIFGGSSHSTCFSDLYLLDLQTLEWSQPDTQGAHINPRSGHAGTMIDENWYIVGGGDNASGSTDTIVMNASKFVWSVVTSVSPRDPLACEGLTLCSTTVDGEKFLVAFGGYNGTYNNEIFVMKLKPRNLVQPRLLQSPAAAAAAASVTAAYAVITATDEKTRDILATDDLDVKRVQPAGFSKQITTQVDALNGEKSKLESRLVEVHDENSKLKDRLDMVKLSHSELTKELKSVQNQLAAEGSRCQKLESQIAAAHKRLESAGSLENELEVLRQQISQVEQTMTTAQRQKSGGVWKWVAGSAEASDDE
ncbi:acyl-CoA-binding domain-containing protein 4 isoform X2 [Oryza brachyantha]|uniref:Acyl-CoA-binding domain-containing protein n=1 Tax=Oryza brachyantha TaxID=4533 RepID=J3LIJ2_ORYBR|nr:acyl-CoA-binding domain-containing protein 4 isoform X1 [Oryza brachyantha]XP_015689493.1 acyl-CoA-binding domain-containing protein 4 isoform X2 [Oryza brachyantha]